MRARRGQTLVVSALTLLLVALMVLTTLMINMKLREKIELQHIADASAYTNAIVTARVYNSIALINRAEVSHMVALSGIESLISWSSAYRGTLNEAEPAWAKIQKRYADQGCTAEAADIANNVIPGLAAEQARVKGIWDALDEAAGKQAFDLVAYMSGQLYQEQWNLDDRLTKEMQAQTFIKTIVKIADKGSRWPGELSAPDAADSTSVREVDFLSGAGATLESAKSNRHAVYATMGTRGDAFLTSRAGADGPLISGLQKVYKSSYAGTSFTLEGSGYFFGTQSHSAKANGVYAWGDDHYDITFQYTPPAGGCLPDSEAGRVEAYVRSTDATDFTDWHEWTSGTLDVQPPTKVHDLPKCVPDKFGNGCPGMWPFFVDYNTDLVTDKDDIFGQPKNFAVIQRDYGLRAANNDPWAFNFHFTFAYGEDWDNRATQLKSGVDLSKQTALAAGLAYYHRYKHWKEPPNLLNPFWRATLVSAEVDKQGELDVPAELNNAGVPYAADMYMQLRGAGFAGTQ